jgi:hypothetical protein
MDSTTTWTIPMSAASSIFLGDWNQLKWGNRENFAMFLGIEPTKMGKTMENNGVFFCEKKRHIGFIMFYMIISWQEICGT